ncbi:MAG: endonuclease/exonuclease/phosphatase family protein [Alphaproteobacteria bacterium]|nr:endonuclease/exonuclease/phosphatase family protein [Alphaproteobacteria bacterium]
MRILTLNTFLLDVRLFGRLPLYPSAPHIAPRLTALPAALGEAGADVICLQEVFRRPHRRFIAQELAGAYPHHAGIRHPGLPLGTGLLVLSRHPITWTRPHEFRVSYLEEKLVIRMGMLECLIRHPALGEVRVINLHLVAGGLFGHPQSERAESVRAHQIAQALELTAGHEQGETCMTVIAGDLNAGPHSSVQNYQQVLDAGFTDIFAEEESCGTATATDSSSVPHITWDPDNPVMTGTRTMSLPPQRIDHVFVKRRDGAPLRGASARVVFHETRVDVGGGRRIPLSDHYGILARIGTDD